MLTLARPRESVLLLLGLLFKHSQPTRWCVGLIHNAQIPINIRYVLLRANRSYNFIHNTVQTYRAYNSLYIANMVNLGPKNPHIVELRSISSNTLWQVWTTREERSPLVQSPGGCHTNTLSRSAYLSPHTWCMSPHSSVNWGEPLVTGTLHLTL